MYQTVQELITQGVKPTQLWWCHLAHPVLMRMELDALVGLATRVCTATAQSPAYFFLDELTYARNWDTWLKSFYDEQRPLRILGTSSSTAALRQGRLESGVGRWEEQFLAPCLFTEYLSLRDKSASLRALPTLAETIEAAAQSITATTDLSRERQRFIFIGGFPELLMRQSRREPAQLSLFEAGGDQQSELASELFHSQRVLRDDAVQKALYIDIPQVFGVGEPLKLERLLYTLAGQMTGLVSFAKLSADVGLTTPTVEKYVSYFERSFLVFLLPNYAPREETVQRRGRKLYFVDGAVRNAALQRGIMPLENPSEMGVLLENVVAAHLFALAQQTGDRLYHWRQGPLEVDFVYDHPEKPLAFEIASSSNHKLTGLRAFQERFPRFARRCYLVSPDSVVSLPRSDGNMHSIGRLPLDTLLIAIGTQASASLQKRLFEA